MRAGRFAKVQVHESVEPLDVLHRHRAVEAQLMFARLVELRGQIDAVLLAHRIAGRQPQEHKEDERYEKDRRDHE